MAVLKFYSGNKWVEVGATKYKVGDMKQFSVSAPDNTWLLCDGSVINQAQYPKLTTYLGTKSYPLILTKNSAKYTVGGSGNSWYFGEHTFALDIDGSLFMIVAGSTSNQYAPSVYKYEHGLMSPSYRLDIKGDMMTALPTTAEGFKYVGFVENIGHLFYQQLIRSKDAPTTVQLRFRVLDVENKTFNSWGGEGVTLTFLDTAGVSEDVTVLKNSGIVYYNGELRYITADGYCDITLGNIGVNYTYPTTSFTRISLGKRTGMRFSDYIPQYGAVTFDLFTTSSTGAMSLTGTSIISVADPTKSIALSGDNHNTKNFIGADPNYVYNVNRTTSHGYKLVRTSDLVTWEIVPLQGPIAYGEVQLFGYDPFGKTYTLAVRNLGVTSHYSSKFIDFREYDLKEGHPTNGEHLFEVHPNFFLEGGRPYRYSGRGIFIGALVDTAFYTATGGTGNGSVLPNVEGGVTYIKAREEII